MKRIMTSGSGRRWPLALLMLLAGCAQQAPLTTDRIPFRMETTAFSERIYQACLAATAATEQAEDVRHAQCGHDAEDVMRAARRYFSLHKVDEMARRCSGAADEDVCRESFQFDYFSSQADRFIASRYGRD